MASIPTHFDGQIKIKFSSDAKSQPSLSNISIAMRGVR